MGTINVSPVQELLQAEFASRDVADALDEIEYEYSHILLQNAEAIPASAHNHIYLLRRLRNAFNKMDKG